MATVRASLSHEERTAREPRQAALEPVILSKIEDVNDTIRLLRLSSVNPKHELKFLPGQWLDVFIPSLSKAGGFTVTSTPREGRPTSSRPAYFELAIQNSSNSPARWLWKPEQEIINSSIVVRAGGSFTWPPPGLDETSINQVVLVAGGVGINPLMSIFSYLLQHSRLPPSIKLVYTTKVEETGSSIDGSRILFLQRLMSLAREAKGTHVQLELFITGSSSDELSKARGLPPNAKAGRITHADLENVLGDAQHRAGTVCYICGPPRMTDEFVDFLSRQIGMDSTRVLCEKWW